MELSRLVKTASVPRHLVTRGTAVRGMYSRLIVTVVALSIAGLLAAIGLATHTQAILYEQSSVPYESISDSSSAVRGFMGITQSRLSRIWRESAHLTASVDCAMPARKVDTRFASLMSSLPDEMHMRDLLRPLEGAGRELLRDMGRRTRAYASVLKAWEDLHVVNPSDGTMCARNNILGHHHSRGMKVQTETVLDDASQSRSMAQAVRTYDSYRAFMVRLGQLLFPWTSPHFTDHVALHTSSMGGGRGVVLTAGEDQAHLLLVMVQALRALGCTLPVEIMYLGNSHLPVDDRTELERLDGVVTRDMSQMFSHHDWKPRDLSGKPFAILFSSFRETILIHTGTLFLHNPEVLFDDPGYKMTGALFFKSPRIMAESERLFLQRVLPNPMPDVVKQSPFWTGKPGQLQDSNVVLVDKRQHFISLLLVCQTNGPDGDRYRSSDTKGVRKPFPVSTEAQNSHCVDEPISHLGEFWLGWELSGNHNYSFHEGNLGIMRGAVLNEPFVARRRSKYYHRTTDGTVAGQQAMTSNAKERDNVNDTLPYRLRICAPQLVHLDLDGRPLWFAGGLLNSGSAAKGQTGYHTFCSFMVEQSDLEEETAWEFQRGDVYCLTSPPDLVSELKKEEDRILDIIVALTTKIDADEEDSD